MLLIAGHFAGSKSISLLFIKRLDGETGTRFVGMSEVGNNHKRTRDYAEQAIEIAVIVQKWDDFAIISIMLLVKAGLYFLQEHRTMLPGESLPVSKKVKEVAYANTIVRQEEMLALVAEDSLHELSHFQKMVIQIGNFLILISLAMVLLFVMVALFRHEPFVEIARFALVLTVAAIPVVLPAVLSVTMAVGAFNLAKRQAIVSRLTADLLSPTPPMRCGLPPILSSAHLTPKCIRRRCARSMLCGSGSIPCSGLW